MNSKPPIAGYTFGEASINKSPISLEELHKLEAAIGWSNDDASWLRIAAETLVPQAEAMVDSWRAVIGSLPQLAASFAGPDGKPDDHYKSAVKSRFVQWISDVCLQPHDQELAELSRGDRPSTHACKKEQNRQRTHTPRCSSTLLTWLYCSRDNNNAKLSREERPFRGRFDSHAERMDPRCFTHRNVVVPSIRTGRLVVVHVLP